MTTASYTRLRRPQAGVTLIELMIAVLILTVGLIAMAQLFVVSTMSNSLAVNTSSGLNEAQRLIEAIKIEASTNGVRTLVPSASPIPNARITSGGYTTTTATGAYYLLTGTRSERFREDIWVYGVLADTPIVSTGYTAPTGRPPGWLAEDLRSPSENARLVIIRMTPKINDPRFNHTVQIHALIGGR